MGQDSPHKPEELFLGESNLHIFLSTLLVSSIKKFHIGLLEQGVAKQRVFENFYSAIRPKL